MDLEMKVILSTVTIPTQTSIPNAAEIVDGLDNDCDNQIDERTMLEMMMETLFLKRMATATTTIARHILELQSNLTSKTMTVTVRSMKRPLCQMMTGMDSPKSTTIATTEIQTFTLQRLNTVTASTTTATIFEMSKKDVSPLTQSLLSLVGSRWMLAPSQLAKVLP